MSLWGEPGTAKLFIPSWWPKEGGEREERGEREGGNGRGEGREGERKKGAQYSLQGHALSDFLPLERSSRSLTTRRELSHT